MIYVSTERKPPQHAAIARVCAVCRREYPRDRMLVKRVSWRRLGKGQSDFRSRAVAWVCESCAELDPDWNLPQGKVFVEQGGDAWHEANPKPEDES